jgi:hypothetical protein
MRSRNAAVRATGAAALFAIFQHTQRRVGRGAGRWFRFGRGAKAVSDKLRRLPRGGTWSARAAGAESRRGIRLKGRRAAGFRLFRGDEEQRLRVG